jgi:hypothetical protein
MKYYLRIKQVLEDEINMPESINLEVSDRDDALSKKEVLSSLISGDKKIEFITCRHEENLPCISETL